MVHNSCLLDGGILSGVKRCTADLQINSFALLLTVGKNNKSIRQRLFACNPSHDCTAHRTHLATHLAPAQAAPNTDSRRTACLPILARTTRYPPRELDHNPWQSRLPPHRHLGQARFDLHFLQHHSPRHDPAKTLRTNKIFTPLPAGQPHRPRPRGQDQV